jgi:hypothetical protein
VTRIHAAELFEEQESECPRRPAAVSPPIKATIVRRHLVNKVPVFNPCDDEYGIQPIMFYNWQKVLVGNAARAFETDGHQRAQPSREADHEQTIAQVEAKLAKKDGFVAEILEECVTLKKSLGSPEQPLGSWRGAPQGHRLRRQPGDENRPRRGQVHSVDRRGPRQVSSTGGSAMARSTSTTPRFIATIRLEPWERTAFISYFQGHPLDDERRWLRQPTCTPL